MKITVSREEGETPRLYQERLAKLITDGYQVDRYGAPEIKYVPPEPKPGCVGYLPPEPDKPRFRIVTDGRRYRVQRRRKELYTYGTFQWLWEDIVDQVTVAWPSFYVEAPFETRWLWRARRRFRREVLMAEREWKGKEWVVIED